MKKFFFFTNGYTYFSCFLYPSLYPFYYFFLLFASISLPLDSSHSLAWSAKHSELVRILPKDFEYFGAIYVVGQDTSAPLKEIQISGAQEGCVRFWGWWWRHCQIMYSVICSVWAITLSWWGLNRETIAKLLFFVIELSSALTVCPLAWKLNLYLSDGKFSVLWLYWHGQLEVMRSSCLSLEKWNCVQVFPAFFTVSS